MDNYILRENPLLQIVLFEDKFEIHQPENQINEYIFKEVDSLKIGKNVNWLVTLFSFLISFIINVSGSIYEDKNQLKFNYQNEPIKISLNGSDAELTKRVVDMLNQKIKVN